jgi:hypothetical protein
MRLRQAKKILADWPNYRTSTTRRAYTVCYKKLRADKKKAVTDKIWLRARIKADKLRDSWGWYSIDS